MADLTERSLNDANSEFLFTIVIIAYNVDAYISECIESAIAQTTKCKYEILVIDDGSKDQSGKIIDSYALKSNKVRVIHKENEGSGFARNTGMKNAKGKWLMFVDGDDYIDAAALENYERFTTYDIDVCLGRISSFINGSDDKPKAMPLMADEKEVMQCENGKDCFVYLKNRNGSVELGTKGIYRRSFLVSNNIYMKQYKRGQDNDWAVNVFRLAGKMAYNPYPYYCYRVGREGSAVNSSSLEKALGVVNMQREWVKIAKDEKGVFGDLLKLETLKRFWGYFKIYSTSLRGKDLTEYCNSVDEARYIFDDIKNKTLWMKMLKKLGARRVADNILFFKVTKIENFLRRMKSRIK